MILGAITPKNKGMFMTFPCVLSTVWKTLIREWIMIVMHKMGSVWGWISAALLKETRRFEKVLTFCTDKKTFDALNSTP